MGQQLTISPIGLKLIKSYEGFRSSDRLLVSGQRVVGYGHRVNGHEAMTLTKTAAERLLKEDLSLFESMINENVHAPLSQSQFDALCSLAFNIGPKAFLSSEVLHALNNGRPLDAASAFDVWRKSNIDGRTYIVDALVRRRTAEKALFLRPDGRQIPASRVDLPPEADDSHSVPKGSEKLPVFTRKDIRGLVADAPYDTTETEIRGRRREDRLTGPLEFSELKEGRYSDNDPEVDMDAEPIELEDARGASVEQDVLELNENNTLPQNTSIPANETDLLTADTNKTAQRKMTENSPIAEAAAEVVEQLDALFDDPEIDENSLSKPVSQTIQSQNERDKQEPIILDQSVNTPDPIPAETKKSAKTLETKRVKDNIDGYGSGTLLESEGSTSPYARVANDLSTDEPPSAKVIPKRASPLDISEKILVEEDLRPKDSSQKYIQRETTQIEYETATDQGPYAVMMIFGLTLIGGFLMTILRGPENLLGTSGPMIAAVGFMIGVMIFTGALYYFLRAIFRGRRDSRRKL